jgi:hypothetical protein
MEKCIAKSASDFMALLHCKGVKMGEIQWFFALSGLTISDVSRLFFPYSLSFLSLSLPPSLSLSLSYASLRRPTRAV